MKILYMDTSLNGHHLSYLKALINGNTSECVIVLPEQNDEVNCKQIIINDIDFNTRKLIPYLKLMKKIYKIVKNENPDIVHFLYGDIFYRFFGLRLRKLLKYNLIITFHHIRKGFLFNLSLNRIFSSISKGVVHTNFLLEKLNKLNIYNVDHIEYPYFNERFNYDSLVAKNELKLPVDVPVLLVLGNTRYDKGLDILLKALNNVTSNFHLLIAGSIADFDEEFIDSNITSYKSNVTKILRYLSDNEVSKCFFASDIIVLPYRLVFDGASGPLAEGVWYRKLIIGPNHGSLGDTIDKYHLGYTFVSEDYNDLALVINDALKSWITWDGYAERYRNMLTCEDFVLKYKTLYINLGSKKIVK